MLDQIMSKLVQKFKLTTKPISLNNVFVNVGKKRARSKKYRDWKKMNMWELRVQTSANEPLVNGEYGLKIEVGRHLTRADIDNLIKPYSDILVELNLTPDDRFLQSVCIKKTSDNFVSISIYDLVEK